MKKTIALLAAMGIVSSASTTVVSCSLKGEKNKGGTTNPSTNNKEVNQILLKKEIQEYLEGKVFDSKEDSINDVQKNKNWKFKGLDKIQCSSYGNIAAKSIYIKATLKEGYTWAKFSTGEFDVIIKINNEKIVKQAADQLAQTYFLNEETAKTDVERTFKEINGVMTASAEKQDRKGLKLTFNVNLTYVGSITGPKTQQVIVAIKNNLNTDVYAANQLITKDNKKYKSKQDAEQFIRSTFANINGITEVSVSWDPWAKLSYIIKINYDKKSFGPTTAEGTIELKANIEPKIIGTKTKFESKEFKNSVDAQKEVEDSLKLIEGVDNVIFKWDDQNFFKYKVKIEYTNDYFGPTSLVGTLKKYQSVNFEQIEDQIIDMRQTNSIELELKGKNIADKVINVSSSNSGIEVLYNEQKLIITNKQNDAIKAVIKVWDSKSPSDTMEFAVTILSKPALVTKMNSEYDWYLNDEKIEEIFTKNFDNTKNDKFELVSQFVNIEGYPKVSEYIDVSLKQDAENQQKFYLHYKFKKALPESGSVQIGLKLNGEIVSQFKLVIKPAADITSSIENILDNIKNKYNWKHGQSQQLKNQVENDLKSVEGINSFIFEWTNEDELEYKVSVAYKLGNTGKIYFLNKGTWYVEPEFETASDITYDMRTPENNTFNVYGKYLSGKSFGVKTDNNDLKVEIVGDVEVEGNLQYLKVKINSTIKDDILSKIIVFQTDDETQQVTINANILALPYIAKTGDNWSDKFKIKIGDSIELKFTVKNFKPDLDQIEKFNDPTDYDYFDMAIITIDEAKGEFAWKITGKVNHWIWSSTNATIKIKYANVDWIEIARVNLYIYK